MAASDIRRTSLGSLFLEKHRSVRRAGRSEYPSDRDDSGCRCRDEGVGVVARGRATRGRSRGTRGLIRVDLAVRKSTRKSLIYSIYIYRYTYFGSLYIYSAVFALAPPRAQKRERVHLKFLKGLSESRITEGHRRIIPLRCLSYYAYYVDVLFAARRFAPKALEGEIVA